MNILKLVFGVILPLFVFCLPSEGLTSVSVSVEVRTKAQNSTEAFLATKDVSVTLTGPGFQRSRGTDGDGVADFGSVPTGNYAVELYMSGYFYYSRVLTISQNSTLKFDLAVAQGVPQQPANLPPPPPPEPAPVLTKSSPNAILNGYPFHIEFTGQNFRRGAVLEYSADGGATIGTSQLVYDSPTVARVYSGGDVPPGTYLVRVKNFDGQVSAPLSVTIQHNPNFVIPPLPTATMSIQSCTVAYNQSTCPVTITWSQSGAPSAGVRGIVSGTPVAQSLILCNPGQNSCVVNVPVGSFDFGVLSNVADLRSSLLAFDRITITKAPPPATASISQVAGCTVPWNGSFCTSGVAWSVQNGPNAGIRVRNMSLGGVVVPGACLAGSPCGFSTTVGNFEVAVVEDKNNRSSRVLDVRTISITKAASFAPLTVNVRSTSGAAISGAALSLVGAAGNYSFGSNAIGVISGNVNYGSYTATVSAAGYLPFTIAYSHAAANSFNVNLSPAVGTLKICIRYGGAPVVGATITASGPTTGTEPTNSTGCTSGAPIIPFGNYSIVASAAGISRSFPVSHNRNGLVVTYEVLTGAVTTN